MGINGLCLMVSYSVQIIAINQSTALFRERRDIHIWQNKVSYYVGHVIILYKTQFYHLLVSKRMVGGVFSILPSSSKINCSNYLNYLFLITNLFSWLAKLSFVEHIVKQVLIGFLHKKHSVVKISLGNTGLVIVKHVYFWQDFSSLLIC